MPLPQLTTRDVEEARRLVRLLAPGMNALPLGSGFELSVRAVAMPKMQLFRMQGRQLRLSGQRRGFFGGTLILEGSVEILDGLQSATYDTDHAHIVPTSDDAFDVRVTEWAAGLGLAFDAALADSLAGRMGVDIVGGARRLDLRTPVGSAVRRLILFAWRELERGGPYTESPEAGRALTELLCSLFLTAAQTPEVGAEPVNPLDLAKEYLAHFLNQPVLIADIAAATGVHARSLYRAFQEAHGTGPISWHRQRRMEAAHEALITADAGGTTVTAIALEFGFTNLGRFSAAYRQEFGESPADTLRGS